METSPTAALAALVGTWRGTGEGFYPTISGFTYADEWTIQEFGKPYLHFTERTADVATGQPMHHEVGYFRLVGDGDVEIVAGMPTGQSELGTGRYRDDAGRLEIETHASVANAPTAKHVEIITRRFVADGDELHYEMSMAAVGQPLTSHLSATLHRV